MIVRFEGSSFELLPEETLLEGIERQGGSLPSFCRRGLCQVCVVKATRGDIPPLAQKGLRDGAKRQSLLLACVCRPTGDLEVDRHGSSASFDSRVEHVEPLAGNVLRVWVSAPPGLVYQAGQYLHVVRPSDGLMRPYSIASLPGGERIELHVACLPGGAMSGWLRSAVGQSLVLRGPFGECVYQPDEPDRPLCLAGTGTGLAPLLGVVRAALAAGHRGEIRLFHGSVRRAGLYLWAELRALLSGAPQLRLVGSLLEGGEPEGDGAEARWSIRATPLEAALAAEGQAWKEHRVYLCGNDELVRKLQKKLYLAGVPLARIHTDPFVAPGARA
jgi:CDP-4-dehydro-6-deoxyglucose reductase, E3